MSEQVYRFLKLSAALTEKAGLDPLPFPVRAEKIDAIRAAPSMPLDDLLGELDGFLVLHPDLKPRYAGNVANLAMLCATRHVEEVDFAAALVCLGVGLRANPQHKGLKLHQALALQVAGYQEAAAMEYEQILWDAPQAYDPVIRVLAARAFAAAGDNGKALELIEFLPESEFHDPGLARLRERLRQAPAAGKFCIHCGEKLPAQAVYCSHCGVKLD
jgi:tetratricopeptide (TPR) repeat protein